MFIGKGFFEDQRFDFVVSNNEFQVAYLLYQGVRFAIERTGLKVGTHPATQVFGFANIDYFAGSVLV